jgi:predicted GNAT family N-acyltransferase
MSSLFPFTVRRVEWIDACNELRAVRKLVFIDEQKVPVDLEWDDLDQVSAHVLARSSEGESIGTGRLLPDGHIGRMAVVWGWRGRGVGSALLQELMRMAREAGFTEVRLNAQTHALQFYASHGFLVEGSIFLDAGIEHRHMRCALQGPSIR